MGDKITKQLKQSKFRYQQVFAELSKRVKSLDEGAKLSSVNALLEEFNASRATVDRAIKELRESGWLKCIRGKGMFVTRPDRGSRGGLPGIVDYLFFGYENVFSVDSFHGEIQHELIRLMGQHGAAVRRTVLDPAASVMEITQTVERLNSEFLVVVCLYKGDTQLIIQDLGVPYILLFPNYPMELPNSFLVDARGIARTWVEHLSGLGHTKIAFLHGINNTYYSRSMHEYHRYFYEEMARHGLVADPDLTVYGGFNPDEGYRAMCELFSRGKKFTAVIINDENAIGVYRAIEEQGLVVGKDISVIATDDMPWCRHMSPPLTSSRISRVRTSEMLFEQISSIMLSGNKQFDKRVVPVGLSVRNSTGPAVGE